jgi:hypothetical protein
LPEPAPLLLDDSCEPFPHCCVVDEACPFKKYETVTTKSSDWQKYVFSYTVS